MEAEFNVYRVGPPDMNPGPAAYYTGGDMYRPNKGVTISPRLSMQNNQTNGRYVSLPSTIGQGPKISLGSRFKEVKPKFIPPGPTYVPPAFGSKCPRFSFPKAKPRKIKPTPGPATYKVRYPSLVDSNHECTIPHSPRQSSFPKSQNDAMILSPRYDKVQKKAPSYPIAQKPKPPKIEPSGEYIAPRSTLSKQGIDFASSSNRAPVFH